MKSWICILPATLFTLAACTNGPDAGTGFVDVTEHSGIHFRYTFGDTTYQNILESSGSGISVFDYDGDGLMDVYLLNGTYLEGVSEPHGHVFANTPNALYRNNGDGTFSETAAAAGLDDRHWSMAAGAFDIDGDGDVDIYLANYGPNVYFENNGDGTFSDATARLGLAGPDSLNGHLKWSAGVTFWDYDVDSRTDILVCNFLAFDPDYVSADAPDMMPHPNEYRGQASMLYRQTAEGTFEDVTRTAGLYAPDAKCMGHTVLDLDGDGDLDLFQGNDHQLNFLYRNDGGRLVEIASSAGVGANDRGQPTGSMHGTPGDVDGDLLVDLLVTDLRYGAMYRNRGNMTFEDVTRSSGIARAFEGKGQWGAALFDYDNDRDLDLLAANGTAEELILQLPLLLANQGDGRFIDAGPDLSRYFTRPRSGRAAVTFDYDNDGDRDVLISHVDLDGRAVLLRNDAAGDNHWLGLTLHGPDGPASAIGARVTLWAGGTGQSGVNQWATSYLSYSDPRVHFGLGSHDRIDSLIVEWPGGLVDRHGPLATDRYLVVSAGEAISEAPTRTSSR